VDEDRSALSRQYLTTLTSDGEVRLVALVSDVPAAQRLLVDGRADIVLVIPPGFAADATARRPVAIQALVDGSDSISASSTLFDISARTAAFNARVVLSGLTTQGLPIEVRNHVWYNPGLKSVVSMVPGLLAPVLNLSAMAVALAMAREKELGSFESLVATPAQGIEYILGKLVTYLVYGVISSIIATAIAIIWFNVPFRGNPLDYLLLTAIYLVATMGFGLLVANFVSSQQAAMLTVLLVFFVPSFFLSGLVLPISTRSWGSQLVSYALPATHFVTISRALFLKGSGIMDLLSPTLVLLGMGGGSLGLAITLFRKSAA
jgi:ABC-2 type transport system permease protein